jgi:hypothetical protein
LNRELNIVWSKRHRNAANVIAVLQLSSQPMAVQKFEQFVDMCRHTVALTFEWKGLCLEERTIFLTTKHVR